MDIRIKDSLNKIKELEQLIENEKIVIQAVVNETGQEVHYYSAEDVGYTCYPEYLNQEVARKLLESGKELSDYHKELIKKVLVDGNYKPPYDEYYMEGWKSSSDECC